MASALKKVLMQSPTSEDIKTLVGEVKTENPRAAAVVAGAVIDDILRQVIVSRMVVLTDDENQKLFGSYGPLGSFGSRIGIGYAMGIYGPKTRQDLLTLKKIRNAFAHAILVIGFETPAVAQLCSKFNCLEGLKARADLTPQELLSVATQCLLVHLLNKKPDLPADAPKTAIEGLD
jgi:hypothetical protein